jgi:hypothetical protein
MTRDAPETTVRRLAVLGAVGARASVVGAWREEAPGIVRSAPMRGRVAATASLLEVRRRQAEPELADVEGQESLIVLDLGEVIVSPVARRTGGRRDAEQSDVDPTPHNVEPDDDAVVGLPTRSLVANRVRPHRHGQDESRPPGPVPGTGLADAPVWVSREPQGRIRRPAEPAWRGRDGSEPAAS